VLGFKISMTDRMDCGEGQNTLTYQISWRSVKPLPRYRNFSIFKMAAVRHVGFLKVGNFNGG